MSEVELFYRSMMRIRITLEFRYVSYLALFVVSKFVLFQIKATWLQFCHSIKQVFD